MLLSTTVAIAALAFLIGALLASILAAARAKARAAAAEARENEVRLQLQSACEEARTLSERFTTAEKTRIAAETRAAETEKHLAEQKVLLDEARTRLSDAFKTLAAEVFRDLKQEAAGDWEARRKAIEALLQPLAQTLDAYRTQTTGALGSVAQQLQGVALTQTSLQTETAKLVNALRSTQVRGRWGEITLRRTAELAGMSVHCDFVEQETAGSGLRPDMIVRLPGGREIVVDSKVPLDGFLDAIDALTDADRDAALTRYAAQMKRHLGNLGSKEYSDQFPAAPEFVVLFLPNDTFLAAAAERIPNLLETALARKIIIATPSTFIALLLAVHYGWRQVQLAENAEQISVLGQELYDRMATLAEHLRNIGGAIGEAVESYNAAVGNLENRVLPAARRFKELGAGGKKDFEEVPPLDHTVRPLG